MSEPRRSRRSKKNVNYSKEQDFSGDEDIFEDSPGEEPAPKRARPRSSRKSTGSRRQAQQHQQQMQDMDDHLMGDTLDDDFRSNKPIYTEKGYDQNLPSIRERFPFLPEFELDGSPRIDLIVGRRPVDEKGEDTTKSGEVSADGDAEEKESEEDDDDEDTGDRRRGTRGKKDDKEKEPEPSSAVVEYEYLVKYKNRSYLHLEWKSGADLESMNKSAKTLYRRYLKKIAAGLDDELENPEFDPSYAVAQKICAEKEQELTLELNDKELLKWEKEREKELAEESDDDEDDDADDEKKKEPEKKEGEAADANGDSEKKTENGGKLNLFD